MINCILIDDEPFARENLKEFIARIPNLNLLGSFGDPLQALEFIDDDIDLIFSDIQMPELDGISFLKTLKRRPAVVLITGHPDFALDGFELDVVDYILKPFGFDRLVKAVNKAKRSLHSHQDDFFKKDYITVQDGHKTFMVAFDEIVYVEGLEDYVKIITTRKPYVSKQTMKHLQTILPPSFIRIQKSYIVNVNCIDSIGASEITLKHGTEKLPIGLKYRDSFYLRLGIT